MHMARRSLLRAASLGAASLATGAAALPAGSLLSEDEVEGLVRRNADGNAALMRGDAATWAQLLPLAADFTLMSPFGGEPSHGAYSPQRIEEIGRFFKGGTFEQQLVQAYASPDMVVLATIERANVAVANLPPQKWLLRVTVVLRRAGSRWELVHRHADPLLKGITVEQSAALTRGDFDKLADLAKR